MPPYRSIRQRRRQRVSMSYTGHNLTVGVRLLGQNYLVLRASLEDRDQCRRVLFLFYTLRHSFTRSDRRRRDIVREIRDALGVPSQGPLISASTPAPAPLPPPLPPTLPAPAPAPLPQPTLPPPLPPTLPAPVQIFLGGYRFDVTTIE